MRMTEETNSNWEAEIRRQLDNSVETLHRIGIDYKAVALVDRVKENNSERTKRRLTFQSTSKPKSPEESSGAE